MGGIEKVRSPLVLVVFIGIKGGFELNTKSRKAF